LVLVLGCVTILAQQTNLGSLFFGDDCSEDCPEDVAPHRCPPGCASCSCVGHGSVVTPAADVVTPEPLLVGGFVACASPKVPDPRAESIFHVPRSLLA
jgi:hypothetical protein